MSNRNDMLAMIKEGMKVHDSQNDKVGTVEFVHFSEANGSRSTGAASPPEKPAQSDLVAIVGKVFRRDNLPEELRERLLMHGFIKIDSKKLFGADRYVMFDQIATVEKGRVHLKVEDSEGLLKG